MACWKFFSNTTKCNIILNIFYTVQPERVDSLPCNILLKVVSTYPLIRNLSIYDTVKISGDHIVRFEPKSMC